MSKTIKCPVCKATGYIPLVNSEIFEIRGKFQGNSIIKCNNCGSGLALGLFSGIFLGTPKLIDKELWEKMEDLWHKEFGTE